MTDYSQQYFTIESLEDGNVITFTIPSSITTSDMTSISYSVDGGTTWNTTTINGTAKTISVSLNRGAKVLWKGIANHLSNANTTYCKFSATNRYIVYGNTMSLLYGDNFYEQTSLPNYSYTFFGLFDESTYLIDASNLILPATTVKTHCYRGMFKGCTSLTAAPELPATTLAGDCYYEMFRECTHLNYVVCLATNISATNCTQNWLYAVAATGTFYKHPSMTGWSTGVNGIPSGWTTKDYMMLTINGKVPAAVKFVQNGVTHDLDYLKFGNNLVWQKTN